MVENFRHAAQQFFCVTVCVFYVACVRARRAWARVRARGGTGVGCRGVCGRGWARVGAWACRRGGVPVGVCGAWRRFFGAVGVHFLRFFGARGAFFLRVFGRNNAHRGAWRGPGKCPGGLARAIFTGANPHKTGVSAFVHRERL